MGWENFASCCSSVAIADTHLLTNWDSKLDSLLHLFWTADILTSSSLVCFRFSSYDSDTCVT